MTILIIKLILDLIILIVGLCFYLIESEIAANTDRQVIMSTPFASKLFENSSNNADGWDEWDWVDNNNVSNAANEQQQQQQQQHQQPQQQYINHQQTPFDPQNVQFNVIDNATHQSNSPMDQPLHSMPISPQLNPMFANNNHINTTAYHQDIVASQLHQPHQQQPTSISNLQTVNNNFVQSPPVNYSPRNAAGCVQVESTDDAAPTKQNLPPVPARPSPKIDQSVQHNAHVVSDSAAYSNTQNENQQVASITEAPTTPISVFDTNSLPPLLPPPSLNQSPFANTNPFAKVKRVGSHAHRTPPPPPPAPQSQEDPSVTTDNTSVIPDTFAHQSLTATHAQETSDTIAHNDRNEYLQTGHLSEDGENNTIAPSIDTNAQYSSSDGNGDSLPPPGLSRLVLGEQETNESANAQPPPGLDRLVTGIEINQSNINLERQADGQDNTGTKVSQIIRNNSQFASVAALPPVPSLPSAHSADADAKNLRPESDRNQYLVAGESVIDSTAAAPMPNLQNSNMQRVVTGLENSENNDKTLPKHQRDINMDGENVEDQQQRPTQQHQHQPNPQQQQQQQNQYQPTASNQNKFANTSNTVSQADSVEDLDTSGNYHQKMHSNASSGDESDREKEYYSRNKSQYNKKTEDRRKKRDDLRYETEDTDHSTRERRRSKDIDRYADKDRGYRGRSVDIDENDSRAYRDRGDKSFRGEKNYRPPSRDDDDRYAGRYR